MEGPFIRRVTPMGQGRLDGGGGKSIASWKRGKI